MNMRLGYPGPAPLSSPKLLKFSNSPCNFPICLPSNGASLLRFSSYFLVQEPRAKLGLLTTASAASSSAPLDAYSAAYLEQLDEATPKQKNDTIDQDEIEDPILLADADSCFCEFNGVQIHHKISHGNLSASSISSKMLNFPIILLHGFGASLFSWNKVMKPLSQITCSKVLAFDRPAFGLTSRVNAINYRDQNSMPLNPFSMIFSVLASLFFIDDILAADKAILIGHSAGALVAVDAYFEKPERIAALILVAPAIFAPLMQNKAKQSSPQNGSVRYPKENRFYKLLSAISKAVKSVVSIVGGMMNMLNSIYRKALASILRSSFGVMMIKMLITKFGVQAVRTAWYDRNNVPDHVIEGYTKPLKMKYWDKALAEYVAVMLGDSVSESKLPLGRRLSEISCPVMIVSGDSDRLVPLWNSRRISNLIPGCCFEVIKNCGHLPQEERAEEFVYVVDKFLHKVFGISQETSQVPAAI